MEPHARVDKLSALAIYGLEQGQHDKTILSSAGMLPRHLCAERLDYSFAGMLKTGFQVDSLYTAQSFTNTKVACALCRAL